MKRLLFFSLLMAPLLLAGCGKGETDNASTDFKWVDMGTGVLWADRNVGATVKDIDGIGYAWGSVKSVQFYTWGYYPHCTVGDDGKPIMTAYTASGSQKLSAKDDIASKVLNGKGKIPSPDDFKALMNYAVFDWKWVNEYKDEDGNVALDNWGEPAHGFVVTNMSTKASLFFPAAGRHSENGGVYRQGTEGLYWTDTQDSDDKTLAKAFYFTGAAGAGLKYNGIVDFSRCVGISIRPVKK